MRKLIGTLIIVSSIIMATSCGTGNNQGNLRIASHVNFGKEDYKKIVSSNNQLGMELLPEVRENENGNVFISPMSLFMALSMVYNGADGVTKEEIAKVLHVDGIDKNELNKANASFMSMLNHDSKQIQLNLANSIWLNNKFHFQTDFAQNNRDYFNAKIQGIDITKSQSPKMINGWVKKSTNGKIDDIVDDPLDTDLVAILINAIYFKGDWKFEFAKEQTEKRPFYIDGKIKEIPLMTLNKKLAYLENDQFQAVSLPYGDGEMSMKVFLPKETSSLAAFKKMLTDDNWKKWSSEFHKKEGTIMLPRFQVEDGILLNEPLKHLGMKSAFYEGANFTKMIKEKDPLKISKVKQKTFIDVNEKGTEAAAATSVEITKTSASMNQTFHMEVNRPFFIAITEDETGMILFMGSITNPQRK
ncbi:MAG TPA: serpin family protein [Bacillales bacterium]|nr:serpin family protein [Bacillales bacterium]